MSALRVSGLSALLGRAAALVFAAGVLAAPAVQADPSAAAADAPRGELRIKVLAGASSVDSNEVTRLARSARIAFALSTTGLHGADHLYILQSTARGVTPLVPSAGFAFLARPGDVTVVPQSASRQPDDAWADSWTAQDGGAVEYLLVAAPSPREVRSDEPLPNLATFLAPPPYVAGPSAEPATVIASARAVWGEEG